MTNEDREKAQISAPDYIRANFHPSDHVAVLVRNRKRGATIQRIATVDKIAAPPFQDWLRYKNEKDGCDVYVGMNALKPGAHSRTKDDILTIRHVYVDLDHEASKSLAAIGQSDLVPEPSYVLQTSPDKFQVIWRVDGIAPDRAEELQRAMVHEFGCDPAATDSTRVLRLPGFANKKYDQDFAVTVHSHTGVVHHSQDFKLRTEPGDAGPTRWNRPGGKTTSDGKGELSQSERDWAYAKRALARGLDPEDYARRTVTKAQAELREGTRTSEISDESQFAEGDRPTEDQRDMP